MSNFGDRKVIYRWKILLYTRILNLWFGKIRDSGRIWKLRFGKIRDSGRIRILLAKIFYPDLETESKFKTRSNLESRIRILLNDKPESESRIRI